MSAATVSINAKLDNGTLISVGGVGTDDLFQNLLGLGFTEAEADERVADMKRAITPVSAGSPGGELRASGGAFVTTPPPQQQYQPPAQQGGGQLMCPTHQRPVKSIPKKDGSGTLHKCVVNDTFVSRFGEPGLKDRCPDSKG